MKVLTILPLLFEGTTFCESILSPTQATLLENHHLKHFLVQETIRTWVITTVGIFVVVLYISGDASLY